MYLRQTNQIWNRSTFQKPYSDIDRREQINKWTDRRMQTEPERDRWTDRQADRHANKQANKQTYKQTTGDRQTNKQPNRQTGDRHTHTIFLSFIRFERCTEDRLQRPALMLSCGRVFAAMQQLLC